MTDQPPVQPPQQPSQQPGQGSPATHRLPPAAGGPAAARQAPSTGWWHETTSTSGGRWAIAVAAGALAVLMLLGVAVAGVVVLRNHDRFGLMGQRTDGYSRGQDNGRGPGGFGGQHPWQPGVPGRPGMRGDGLGGLGGLGGLQGGALHGNVTATVNGSVQALVFQRGQVTALSATSITLKSTDGFVGTYGRAAATSVGSAPVTGGQAIVLARASDKVALTITTAPAGGGVGPKG